MHELAGGWICTTLNSVGKSFSETPRTTVEKTIPNGIADMFCHISKPLAVLYHIPTGAEFVVDDLAHSFTLRRTRSH
ncbi:hypothetical protein IAE29_23100 [Ochrobactrum sp. S46]|nr:hypothetical protein [Ochrobactrum sp. S45]MBK0046220.1 hypothetical protein [Ochrobactrum sp. S46]